jgi:hypothetical protein
MWMRSLPRGLMVMGAVLAAAVAVSAYEDQKSAAGCSVCATQTECPAMRDGTRVEMHTIQSGAVMLMSVSDPDKVASFHQGWDQCKAEMDKAMKLSKEEAKSQLCGMCNTYYGLTRQGAQWETIKTDNGVLCLLTAKKSKLVQAIHQQMTAQKEMMAKQQSCCESR